MHLLAERPSPRAGHRIHDGIEATSSRPPGLQHEDAALSSFCYSLGSGYPLDLYASSPSELM